MSTNFFGGAFVSHDGANKEVYVEKGEGRITDIKFSPSGTAQIIFTNSNPKITRPQGGWVQPDSEILELAKKKYESNETVRFRIEHQRKPKADQEAPISELRKDMETANANVSKILAWLDGVFSDEAVTNPEADPASGGRVSALNQPSQNQAQHPQQNQGHYNNVPGSVSAMEGKPWERLNPDGTHNVGSYSVLAAGRTEHAIRKELVEAGYDQFSSQFDWMVAGYVISALTIMDKIQSYVTGKPANRLANSHTRAREIVLDTIENMFPISKIKDGSLTKNEWFSNVGKASMNRLTNICKVDSEGGHFDLNAFLGEQKPENSHNNENSANSSSASQKPQEAPQRQQNAPTQPSTTEGSSAPQNSPEDAPKPMNDDEVNALRPMSIDEVKASMERISQMSKNKPNSDALLGSEPTTESSPSNNASSEEVIELFPRNNQKRDQEGKNPDPVDMELAQELKELVEDAGVLEDLTLLLNETFNVSKVAEIENSVLKEFVEFYADREMSSDNYLKKVIAKLKKA